MSACRIPEGPSDEPGTGTRRRRQLLTRTATVAAIAAATLGVTTTAAYARDDDQCRRAIAYHSMLLDNQIAAYSDGNRRLALFYAREGVRYAKNVAAAGWCA
jgi:hypothetical protein